MARSNTLRFEAFGLCAEVHSEDVELLARVPEVLPPGWQAPMAGRPSARFAMMRDGTITLDGATVAGPDEVEGPLVRLERALRHHVAEHAPDHVFVHAGVVALGGHAIVIPGRSMTGKTTLVAHLVRIGATYYSDEYAVIDSEGMIHAYPHPLRQRYTLSSSNVRVTLPPPRDVAALAPLRARLIVVTAYERDATWQPRQLSAGEGAMALLDNTVVARLRPVHSLAAARQVTAGAEILGGPRGEADLAAEAILGRAELFAG